MKVPQGDTYHLLFTTRAFATGIPGTLSAATVAVYEDGTATPIQTSVAVTEDHNSITGLNYVPIVATSGNGYDAGSYYSVVIEAGTVDSVSVVGEVVGHFRCVAAEGAAGTQDVNVASVTAAALTNAAFDDGALTSDKVTSVGSVVNEAKQDLILDGIVDIKGTGFVKDTHSLQDIMTNTAWDTVTGHATEAKQDIINATVDLIEAAVITNAAGADIAADIIAVKDETALIVADTGELQSDWADGGRLDLIQDIIAADTTTAIPALIAAAQTDLDTLTDTSAEPTGVPAASATLLTKVGYLYMALRNQVDVTATKKTFHADGGIAEWEKDLSESGGTYSESEGNAI
ncbi:MAG: hypothetical protein GY814_20390 [Gammaproteobacteria bacterium]|nr:hypothetical protein [Gammaproteobacteria bacterium]